ncbi:MAG: M23 family metallopeptidase [Proteobacteria bacterium]|nr:M23 family metallopeptidase [Pseudomonadota bacterium]
MKQILSTLILVFAVLLYSGNVEALDVQLEAPGKGGAVKQGDVILVKAKSPAPLTRLSGEFDGKRVYFESEDGRDFSALIGMDLNQKVQEYDLYIFGRGDGELNQSVLSFNVHSRNYKVERLTLPDKMVTYDDVTLKRIKRESHSLQEIRKNVSRKRWWNGDFLMPVKGKLTPNFGARRILNGIKKNPHSGVDVKAYSGTRIRSSNGGKVVLVDNHYFGGKVVVIDHGQGLSTIYMHLSRILVNHGEEVAKGDILGLVGATGRATGPHLHWAAYLNGAKVDPSALLALSIDDKIVVEGSTISSDPARGRQIEGNADSIMPERLGGT